MREFILGIGLLLAFLASLYTLGTFVSKEVIGVYKVHGVIDGQVYLLNGTVNEFNIFMANKTVKIVDGIGLIAGHIVGIYTPIEPVPVLMGIVTGPAVVTGRVSAIYGHYVKVEDYIYLSKGAEAIVIEGQVYKVE